jgi:hypothetical protein
MRSLRTFFSTLAVVALAACGGGSGGGALPSVPTDSGALAPSGSTVAFEKATIWVADDTEVNAYSTNANGTVTPLKTLGSFPWKTPSTAIPGFVDLAIAPDGTQWLLENRDFAQGGSGWRLFAVAPGDDRPENVYGNDADLPFGFALGGDGVLVGYYDHADGKITIGTFPYRSNFVPPMRTWKSTSPVSGFAESKYHHFFVARPNGFEVYNPSSNGCCPIRSVVYAGTQPKFHTSQGFAVGPDDSVYVVDQPGNYQNPVMYVNVYRPGTGTLARRIGPLTANYSGLSWPAITVDALDRLYVATNGHIYRYGPGANGTAQPQRVITNPRVQQPGALSVGPNL